MSIGNQHGRSGRLVLEDGSMINQADYIVNRTDAFGKATAMDVTINYETEQQW